MRSQVKKLLSLAIARLATAGPVLVIAMLCRDTAFAEVKPAHVYEFDGSLADSVGGPAMESAGGVLEDGHYVFKRGEGPRVSGALQSVAEYTIEMVVRLDEVANYRALINFDNLGKEERSVFVRDGCIQFYPLGRHVQSVTVDFTENSWKRLVVTREAASATLNCYVDGRLRLTAHDPNGKYIANGSPEGVLHFCRDEGTENSAGKLELVRIYHRALTAAEVAALGKAPVVAAERRAPVAARPVRSTPAAPVPALPPVQPSQREFADPNPSPHNGFGKFRVTLATGNVVITSAHADIGGITDCGAVYLFDGSTGAVISTLTGSSEYDCIGSGGVTALTCGNFVVSSPLWDLGAIPDAGAVTWGHGRTGVQGAVSAENSLTGSSTGDRAGFSGVTALTCGHYVVCSAAWDDGPVRDAGAATWGDGSTGVHGAISTANSLTGFRANDLVGSGGAIALANGNYVVCSPAWDAAGAVNAGAVTWADGLVGRIGTVGAENSLTGSSANDLVGSAGIRALPDGDYEVHSPDWNDGAAKKAGAVIRGNGAGGTCGPVSPANSRTGKQQ